MKNLKLKITFNAPVTLGFVFLACLVLLLGTVTGGASTQLLFMTYRSSLLSPLTYLRLFTHVLGHSGWDHYVGNMAYILLLGPMLEEKYGSDKILKVIVVTALITGIINFVLFPASALCVFIGQQVAEGLFVRDNISNLSHIVGGLVGAGAGYALNMHKKKY